MVLAREFLTSFAVLLLSGLSFANGLDTTPPLIHQAPDDRHLAVLRGNTAPETRVAADRGALPDSFLLQHMLLLLKRAPEQEHALNALIDELHNPASPNYHRWLSADEFGRRFGLGDLDLATITAWLNSHSLRVNAIYPNRMLVDFSGTAAQVREAFHTEIHRLSAGGQEHIANISDPSIPAELAPAVEGIVSLHDFMPRPLIGSPGYTFSSAGGEITYALTPGDLATIYNLTPLFEAGYTGEGRTVAVIELMDLYNPSDWTTFRDVFGLSSYTSGSLATMHPAPPKGKNNCVAPGFIGEDAEAIVDAEWASAAAPGAAVHVASCANTSTTFGPLIALENLVNSSTNPSIISISYGRCESFDGATANAAYNSAYQQGVAEGISIFVAAGDSGAACNFGQTDGISINGLASTAYNVAVGGTDFEDTYLGVNGAYWAANNTSFYASAESYIPEIPWNDSCGSLLLAYSYGYKETYGSSGFCHETTDPDFLSTMAGGGGPSNCATLNKNQCEGWTKPSWQTGVIGLTKDGVRDLPDISLFAGKGVWKHAYVYCDSAFAPCTAAPATWSYEGGTSFGAPIMAGIQAVVNQKTGDRQGNPNYVYYQLAAKQYGAAGNAACNSSKGNQIAATCTFQDVTVGDMDVPCTGALDCYSPQERVGVLSLSSTAFEPAYTAATGWDFATGIGTVNAYNLVNNWPSTGTASAAVEPKQ